MKYASKIYDWSQQNKLLLALVAAVLVSLILVTISMILYVNDPVSRLDVSKPQDESVRTRLVNGTDETFAASGSLTQKDAAKFQEILAKKQKLLKTFGSFDDDSIGDERLHFNVP